MGPQTLARITGSHNQVFQYRKDNGGESGPLVRNGLVCARFGVLSMRCWGVDI